MSALAIAASVAMVVFVVAFVLALRWCDRADTASVEFRLCEVEWNMPPDTSEMFPAPREDDCAYGCCKAGDVGIGSEVARTFIHGRFPLDPNAPNPPA